MGTLGQGEWGEAPAKWPESWSRAKAVPTAWGGLAPVPDGGRGEETTPAGAGGPRVWSLLPSLPPPGWGGAL